MGISEKELERILENPDIFIENVVRQHREEADPNAPTRKMVTHKYHAQPVTTEDGRFDSTKEARRWESLKLLQRVGAIENLRRQVPYLLLQGWRDPRVKRKIRSAWYVADFVYEADGRTVVEDCKGVKTPVYLLKLKLFLKQYPDVDFKET